MNLSEKIIMLYTIDEKLIVLNKGKRNGQVAYLAGGSGSGKGFAASNFIDLSRYKAFDVDALKQRIINLAKIKDANSELANLDLKKPTDVAKLHAYVKTKGLDDKIVNNFLKNVDKNKGLPNILFDVTLREISKFNKNFDKLSKFGYESKDMHIIWVLTDYNIAVVNNQTRDRIVPSDMLFKTHKGAAETMTEIIKGKLPKGFDGEFHIILNNPDNTVPFIDPKTGAKIVNISKLSGKENLPVKSFTYMKLKDAGKKLKSEKEIQDIAFNWIKKNIPKADT